jgi:hypothetical protein
MIIGFSARSLPALHVCRNVHRLSPLGSLIDSARLSARPVSVASGSAFSRLGSHRLAGILPPLTRTHFCALSALAAKRDATRARAHAIVHIDKSGWLALRLRSSTHLVDELRHVREVGSGQDRFARLSEHARRSQTTSRTACGSWRCCVDGDTPCPHGSHDLRGGVRRGRRSTRCAPMKRNLRSRTRRWSR